ncbi:MAG: MMPL family transporter, partial [Polyangiales bacterium]
MTRSALDRWLTALQARRRWVLALATLVSLTALPGLARLESDNAPEVFFAADAVGRRTLQAFRQRYGSDRFVRVALSGPHLWRKQSLAALPRLSRRLSQVAGVTQVSGLHERDAALGRAWPPSDLEALRRQAVRDPLSRALGWVGAKGRVLTLLVHLKRQSAVGERATLVALRQVVHATLPAGLSGALSGLPVLSARLDDSAADIPRLYFPWLIVLATLLLWLRFRRLAAVAQALALVALTCVCTLGWMGYAEVRLNLVLVTLLPLLFSLSLATVVHVQVDVMRHRRQGHSAQHALAQSYRDKGWALLWAGLTTSAGFASLLSSNVAPIRMLGGWTALGLAWMTLLVFGLLPLLLASNTSLSQVPLPQGCAMRAAGPWACRRLERGLLRWRGAWLGWPLRYARSVVLGFALVALAAALALPHLHSRSDAVDYLPAADPVRRDIRALEAAGIGSASVEVDLRWPKAAPSAAESAPPAADSLDLDALAAAEDAPPTPSHPLLEPARYQALTRFVRALRRHPDVLQALAPTDVIAAAFRAHPEARLLPPAAGRGVAVQALGGFRRVPLRHLSTPSGAHTRVSVLVRTGDVAALADIERHIRTQAGRHLKAATLTLTGAYPLLLHTQQALL